MAEQAAEISLRLCRVVVAFLSASAEKSRGGRRGLVARGHGWLGGRLMSCAIIVFDVVLACRCPRSHPFFSGRRSQYSLAIGRMTATAYSVFCVCPFCTAIIIFSRRDKWLSLQIPVQLMLFPIFFFAIPDTCSFLRRIFLIVLLLEPKIVPQNVSSSKCVSS